MLVSIEYIQMKQVIYCEYLIDGKYKINVDVLNKCVNLTKFCKNHLQEFESPIDLPFNVEIIQDKKQSIDYFIQFGQFLILMENLTNYERQEVINAQSLIESIKLIQIDIRKKILPLNLIPELQGEQIMNMDDDIIKKIDSIKQFNKLITEQQNELPFKCEEPNEILQGLYLLKTNIMIPIDNQLHYIIKIGMTNKSLKKRLSTLKNEYLNRIDYSELFYQQIPYDVDNRIDIIIHQNLLKSIPRSKIFILQQNKHKISINNELYILTDELIQGFIENVNQIIKSRQQLKESNNEELSQLANELLDLKL